MSKKTIGLWLVTQDQNNDYYTYDSFVCAAASEQDAKDTHPLGRWDETYCWAQRGSEKIKAKKIGSTVPGDTEPGVWLASFNAG